MLRWLVLRLFGCRFDVAWLAVALVSMRDVVDWCADVCCARGCYIMIGRIYGMRVGVRGALRCAVRCCVLLLWPERAAAVVLCCRVCDMCGVSLSCADVLCVDSEIVVTLHRFAFEL